MDHSVLIVDDSPDDIEITRRALKNIRKGLRVEFALRGEEALARLKSAEVRPSVILLDLKMPGMSGIDTLRQIKADKRLSAIPVIIVTSSSLESDRRQSLESGADSFLHKHFDLDLFSSKLDLILKRWIGK